MSHKALNLTPTPCSSVSPTTTGLADSLEDLERVQDIASVLRIPITVDIRRSSGVSIPGRSCDEGRGDKGTFTELAQNQPTVDSSDSLRRARTQIASGPLGGLPLARSMQ